MIILKYSGPIKYTENIKGLKDLVELEVSVSANNVEIRLVNMPEDMKTDELYSSIKQTLIRYQECIYNNDNILDENIKIAEFDNKIQYIQQVVTIAIEQFYFEKKL